MSQGRVGLDASDCGRSRETSYKGVSVRYCCNWWSRPVRGINSSLIEGKQGGSGSASSDVCEKHTSGTYCPTESVVGDVDPLGYAAVIDRLNQTTSIVTSIAILLWIYYRKCNRGSVAREALSQNGRGRGGVQAWRA